MVIIMKGTLICKRDLNDIFAVEVFEVSRFHLDGKDLKTPIPEYRHGDLSQTSNSAVYSS